MTARVEISVSSSAVKGILMALWDSGCIRNLVSPQVVEKLWMRLGKLRKPIAFPQLDGLITGSMGDLPNRACEAKAGTHKETI